MNSEGYPDKTADRAIAHVMKQQKNKATSRFSEHRSINPHKQKGKAPAVYLELTRRCK